jgi:hypothetical protein
MTTTADIARNNVLRRQALARAHVLRREALRQGWDAVEAALRRLAALRSARHLRRVRAA